MRMSKNYSEAADIVGGVGLAIIFIALGITLTKACDKACDNVTLVTPTQEETNGTPIQNR